MPSPWMAVSRSCVCLLSQHLGHFSVFKSWDLFSSSGTSVIVSARWSQCWRAISVLHQDRLPWQLYSLFSTSVRTTEETTGWSSNCCLHTSLYPNQLANSQSMTDSRGKFCNQGRAYRHTPNKNHAHGFATSATTLKTWTKVTLHRALEGTSMEKITY